MDNIKQIIFCNVDKNDIPIKQKTNNKKRIIKPKIKIEPTKPIEPIFIISFEDT